MWSLQRKSPPTLASHSQKPLQISLGQTPLCWPTQVSSLPKENPSFLDVHQVSGQGHNRGGSRSNTPSPSLQSVPVLAWPLTYSSYSLQFPVQFLDASLANHALGLDPILCPSCLGSSMSIHTPASGTPNTCAVHAHSDAS